MRPYPAASIRGSVAASRLRYPPRWTPSTAAQSSAEASAMRGKRRIPAVLTTMSNEPNRATVSSTSPCTAAASVTEIGAATARPPAASMRRTVASALRSPSGSPRRLSPLSSTTTVAPRRASSTDTSEPIPPPPPVTIATRSRTRPTSHPSRQR